MNERERENWLTQLLRLGSPKSCSQQAGDQEEPMFPSKSEGWNRPMFHASSQAGGVPSYSAFLSCLGCQLIG